MVNKIIQAEDFGLRNRLETGDKDTGKIRQFINPEYCFRVPSISGTFLPDPVRMPRPKYTLQHYSITNLKTGRTRDY